MKRQLTLKIADEEVSVLAYRDGDEIVIERGSDTVRVRLISDSIVIPAGEGSAAPTARPVPAPRVSAVPSRPAPPPAAPAHVSSGAGGITSPMVGTVKEVLVAVGDTVKTGDRVVVLEAMKMDIDVVAHDPGTVAEVSATPGQNVTEGQQLLRLEAGSEG